MQIYASVLQFEISSPWSVMCSESELSDDVGVGMGCTLSLLWKHNKGQPANYSGTISVRWEWVQIKLSFSLFAQTLYQVNSDDGL